MKSRVQSMFAAVAMMIFVCLFTACGGSAAPTGDLGGSTNGTANDRPTIPKDVAEGIDSLYDFRFSERYDDRISDEFSLMLDGVDGLKEDKLFLLKKYQNDMEASREQTDQGDGMVPHQYKTYWYSFEAGGSLTVRTDYYEPDGVEYISYLWTDTEGAKTSQNIAVGSTEEELLSAYSEGLYFLSGEQVNSQSGTNYGNDAPEYDCGYAWQPYTVETGDIRDITFYIRGGKVAAIELIEPFELRYVYGYDRDAGLQQADERRKK